MPFGAWLRGERRSARPGFAFSRSPMEVIRARLGGRDAVLSEPPVATRPSLDRDVLFSQVPPWQDYFAGLRENREMVLSLFARRVSPRVARVVAGAETPRIAVHLRRGDFRALRPGEDFARTGGTRTPDEFFMSLIETLRVATGWEVPVTLFSDGTDQECAALLALPSVRRAEEVGDLGHMLLMAKADVIVTSAGSTFSMWSGFLSQAAVLFHPAHFHARTRLSNGRAETFEGVAPLPGYPIDPVLGSVLTQIKPR